MTGTPLQNNLTELWSQLNFIMPKLFKSAEDFNSWFNFDSAKNVSSQGMTQEMKLIVIQILHRVIKPFMLRRTKADLETKLPPKTEINISIPLTEMQYNVYQELLKSKTILYSEDKKGLHNMVIQLQKCCNHPYLFDGAEDENSDEFGEHLVTNSSKLVFLDKLLKKIMSQNEQCLIFSTFTTLLDILEDFLKMRGI